MNASALQLPVPGTLHGPYPQREVAPAAWATRWLAQRAPALDAGDWTQQVNAAAARLGALDEAGLAPTLHALRADLARQGFAPDVVARVFAVTRVLSQRTLGLRHHDEQLFGGWLLLQGQVIELDTGAGKTLTATLAAATAALAGVPVHVVTVNDYLAERDALALAPLYGALGLRVAAVVAGMDNAARQAAYRCDITYTTNKQLAFDHLRDRLLLQRLATPLQLRLARLREGAPTAESLLLRGLCFAIVDEADSVLIDEARTPLILSTESGNADAEATYRQALVLAAQLQRERDYTLDERRRSVTLTDHGHAEAERLAAPLGGVWAARRRAAELLCQALAAQHLYRRDQHYLVRDGKVEIVDEFTGRTLADRSWERGLHQLIEAKEGCQNSAARDTLARISYQQFFRRYLLLAGMTGTAREVRGELQAVYRLPTTRVASHWPDQRVRQPTRVLRDATAKWQAVLERVVVLHAAGRPVLVGTRSVGQSEIFSALLTQNSLRHAVLNARNDTVEAQVVAGAGQRGSIVVATNMAGRGTDIQLEPGVAALGGLHVIATEAHEAGRIDRQLFGRCGRQGDPGSCELLAALDDELLRLHLPAPLKPLWQALRRGAAVPPQGLARALVRAAQRAAEREHSRQRTALLASDRQLDTLLAFSGTRQ